MREHVRSGRPGRQRSEERAGAARPRAAEPAGSIPALLALQRTAGNAAVTAALAVQRVPEGRQAQGERLSARVLSRLRVANSAIRQVQADTRHAANQQEGLMHTLYNSSLRAVVQQHDGFWDLSGVPRGTDRGE
ncbi:MAG: hypothetical protein ACREMZ_17640, partial [Gemmatimonadales bacterium]